ncbi:hypothetical protein [Methanopyrus kandleri]|uniref:Uncharacterized protein n=2 Tax=Methanopyrus kandleri TaxID=2320 RepID=Q8TXM2_METKA|nr:hypothetical protein [Methanopyrus kandleri]AAM01855.1 Uncharacterized protein MK0640 [Methanopyrus kandleri AV19]HII70135.1 hypothetical protein [Methanopyrus kandleri]
MGNLPRPAAWLAALTAVLLAVVGPAHGLTQTNAALNPQPVQGLNVEGASKPTSLVIDNSGNLGAVEAGNPPTQAWTTAPIVATVYTQPKVAKAEMVGGNIDFTVSRHRHHDRYDLQVHRHRDHQREHTDGIDRPADHTDFVPRCAHRHNHTDGLPPARSGR